MIRRNRLLLLSIALLSISLSTFSQYDIGMRAGLSYGLIGSESKYHNYGEKSYNNLSYIFRPSFSYEANINRIEGCFLFISGIRIINFSGTEVRSVYRFTRHDPSSPYINNRNININFFTIGIPLNIGFKANKISWVFGINLNRSFLGKETFDMHKSSKHSSDGYHYVTLYDTVSYVNNINYRNIHMNELIIRLKIDLSDNLAIDFGMTTNIIKAGGIAFDLKKANFFDFGVSYKIKEFNFRRNGTQIDAH